MTKKALVPFQAVALIPSGLTGATAATRYVGGTASGAPTTGTFVTGDWIVDQTGVHWVCTAGGSPGTWISSPTSGANSFSGLQTFNAGVTLPSGQALITGTRSVVTGTRSVTTNASDTVDLGTFSTTGGALELRIHAHLAAPAAGTTASVTKVYEIAASALMGTVSTWYLCLPADASASAAATNDFALEVQRTAANTFQFRFRQKSIGLAGVITFTAETLGDTAVTFAPSTTITAAPAAVTTPHPSNAFVAAAGNIGIGTEAPISLLHVAGDFTGTGISDFGNGASADGGTINVRNPAAAALTQHTMTMRRVASQTGNMIRVLDETVGNVIMAVTSSGRIVSQSTDALTPATSTTYALYAQNSGGIGVAIGSDANFGYIQSFTKPLKLNHAGNAVQSLQGINLGDTSALAATIYSGSGAPGSTLGVVGDIYLRTGTPTTSLQRIYIKTTSSVWTGII